MESHDVKQELYTECAGNSMFIHFWFCGCDSKSNILILWVCLPVFSFYSKMSSTSHSNWWSVRSQATMEPGFGNIWLCSSIWAQTVVNSHYRRIDSFVKNSLRSLEPVTINWWVMWVLLGGANTSHLESWDGIALNQALAVGEMSQRTGIRPWAAAWGKFSQQAVEGERVRNMGRAWDSSWRILKESFQLVVVVKIFWVRMHNPNHQHDPTAMTNNDKH